jgi:hypothetical protein
MARVNENGDVNPRKQLAKNYICACFSPTYMHKTQVGTLDDQ